MVMQKSPYLLLFSYSKLEYYRLHRHPRKSGDLHLEFRIAVLKIFVVMGAFAADKFRAGAGGNQDCLADMRLLHVYWNGDFL